MSLGNFRRVVMVVGESRRRTVYLDCGHNFTQPAARYLGARAHCPVCAP